VQSVIRRRKSASSESSDTDAGAQAGGLNDRCWDERKAALPVSTRIGVSENDLAGRPDGYAEQRCHQHKPEDVVGRDDEPDTHAGKQRREQAHHANQKRVATGRRDKAKAATKVHRQT
jgi:hypothetical protein